MMTGLCPEGLKSQGISDKPDVQEDRQEPSPSPPIVVQPQWRPQSHRPTIPVCYSTQTHRSLLLLVLNVKGEECYNIVWTHCELNQNIPFNHLFAHAYSVQLFRSLDSSFTCCCYLLWSCVVILLFLFALFVVEPIYLVATK